MTTRALARVHEQPAPRRTGRWWWFALSSMAIAVMAAGPYATDSLRSLAADDHGVAANYVDRSGPFQVALYLHITFGALALLLSALQFAARVRRASARAHRVLGRVVVSSVLVAGPAGLVLSWVNEAGWAGRLGFGLLTLAWTSFTVQAFRTGRRRDLVAHRRWATRMFAATYAGVTLRLWSVVLVGVQVALGADADAAFDRAYFVVTFLSWVPNVIVAEWWIRHSLAPTTPRSTR